MVAAKTFLYFALLATSALAVPLEDISTRDTTLHCKNVALDSKKNTLSESKIEANVKAAPTKPGKSGYPHEFQNKGGLELDEKCAGKKMLEFPVFADGKLYNYDKKPKPNPGPFRAIYTEDDKTYCGTISHDGTKEIPPKKKGEKPTPANPNAGNFHVCTA